MAIQQSRDWAGISSSGTQLNVAVQWLLLSTNALLRSIEGGEEVCNELLEGSVGLWRDLAVFSDAGKKALVAGLDVLGELLFESGDLCGVHFVKVTTDTTVNDGNLKKRIRWVIHLNVSDSITAYLPSRFEWNWKFSIVCNLTFYRLAQASILLWMRKSNGLTYEDFWTVV